MSNDESPTQAMNDAYARHIEAGRGPVAEVLGDDPALRTFESALSAATLNTVSTRDDVEKALSDDLVPVEGRRRLARERVDKSRSTLKDAAEVASTSLEVVRRKLEAKVLPDPPTDPGAVQLAREDLRLALDGSSDPLGTAADLVREDPAAASLLLRTKWGERLLRSMGVEGADKALTAAAVQGAANWGDEKQRAAAKALDGAIVDLSKAQGAAMAVASTHVESAPEL